MTDNINPSHYTSGKVECIDALEAATANLSGIEAVCTANAIKYLWRWKQKNGLEDLRKARWYIDRLIDAQSQPATSTPARAEELQADAQDRPAIAGRSLYTGRTWSLPDALPWCDLDDDEQQAWNAIAKEQS